MNDNSFENYPGEKLNSEPSEADLARADKWQSAMASNDVPAFSGDVSMSQESAPPEVGVGVAEAPAETADQNNEGLSDAAAIINYGLNAAAKEYGVETVVQKIKSFNVSGSETPIKDLFVYLGVDIPAGLKEVKMEREAARPQEADFYKNSPSSPVTRNRSEEGAFQAIKDMKELISEVEGADPRYEKLREAAKAAGKGYFEYAVGSRVNRGLTDLFDALAAEPKKEESEESQLPEEEPKTEVA